jgi:hypothetical protein
LETGSRIKTGRNPAPKGKLPKVWFGPAAYDTRRLRPCRLAKVKGFHRVPPFRPAFRSAIQASVLAVAMSCAASFAAQAQGKLDARFSASLAGIPIGKGAWVIDITEDQYTAAASGQTSGLLRIFASGQGTSAARGTVAGGQPVPVSYASSITADKKTDEVRMTLGGGGVQDYVAEPPLPPNAERAPLTDAHRRGVIDPMTASLMRVPGTGNPVSQEVCQRKVSIFDGRMRYDVQLAFKRMDKVKAEKGYQGPVVVCALYFLPLGGHIPGRSAIKYLVAQRDMEVWLAPIAGTRILVPYRISIPTPIGLGVMEATQFISTALPPRASATSAKTQ